MEGSRYSLLRGLFMVSCLLILGLSVLHKVTHTVTQLEPHPMQAVQTVTPNAEAKPAPQVEEKRERPSPPMLPAESVKVEAKPAYVINPRTPDFGSNSEYTFILEECHRSGEEIICSGKATNKRDARTKLALHGGQAVDDEGNSMEVHTGFSGSGLDTYLLPDVPTSFQFQINEKHQNAKSVNLEIYAHWESEHSMHDNPVFKDVPIQ